MSNANTQHRFTLARGTRPNYANCPQCGKRKFKRYVDQSEQVDFPDYVGKCERLDNCGYHYPPKQYFLEHPNAGQAATGESRVWEPPPPPPVDYIPAGALTVTLDKSRREQIGLFAYMRRLFGSHIAHDLFDRYFVGVSKHWCTPSGHLSAAFVQRNLWGQACQVKVMAFHPVTGKRLKENEPVGVWDKYSRTWPLDKSGNSKSLFAGKRIMAACGNANPNLTQCLFGEHLLANDYHSPEKRPAAIVEAERTAMVCSIVWPGFIWLATGGKSNGAWNNPERWTALRGRKVILFPDLKAYDEWHGHALKIAGYIPDSEVSISDYLEKRATPEQRGAGFDLEDFLLAAHQCPHTGLLNDLVSGYPIAWDYKEQVEGAQPGPSTDASTAPGKECTTQSEYEHT